MSSKSQAKQFGDRETRFLDSIANRAKQSLAYVKKEAPKHSDWMSLHNSFFGPGGLYKQLFPVESHRAAFAKTAEFAEINQIIESKPWPEGREPRVRESQENSGDEQMPSGQIRLRMPPTLHAALIRQAESENVSLNTLILSKICLDLKELVQ